MDRNNVAHSRSNKALLVLFVGLSFYGSVSNAQSLAVFPGAVGYGIDTPAGRGGEVYKVTNLNASGPGSLEECTSASGPRVCIFEVSGVIKLSSDLVINKPYITVAGQTAPSPGIMLRGAGIVVNSTHDVLIQHLSIGAGDDVSGPDVKDRDSAKVVGSTHHVVFDHISFYWSTDETVSVWAFAPEAQISDVTFSNCIIAEGLHEPSINPTHTSKGLIVGHERGSKQPTNIAIVKNLFAHNLERNPFTTSAFIANNLVYNWSWQAIDIRGNYQAFGTAQASVVGNVFEDGSDTDIRREPILLRELNSDSEIYVSDNDARWLTDEDQWADLVASTGGTDLGDVRSDSPPLWPTGYIAQNSGVVKYSVLASVGSRPADRDATDRRIISNVIHGIGRLINCVGNCVSGDTQVPGGWPSLEKNTRSLTVPGDPNGDDNGNGYTNLEEWLHSFLLEAEGPGGLQPDAPAIRDNP